MSTTNIGRFDPITLEVLWTRMISIVDEAAAALVRTSFSTVVRESHDFSCVITDAVGPLAGAGDRQHPVFHRHPAGDDPAFPRRKSRPSSSSPAT